MGERKERRRKTEGLLRERVGKMSEEKQEEREPEGMRKA